MLFFSSSLHKKMLQKREAREKFEKEVAQSLGVHKNLSQIKII